MRSMTHRPSVAAHGELLRLAAELPGLPPGSVRLPTDLTGLAPESALLLAELYLRFAHDQPWPDWRRADLPPGVRVAWLRAAVRHDPALLRTEPPGELLRQAVAGLDPRDTRRPALFSTLTLSMERAGADAHRSRHFEGLGATGERSAVAEILSRAAGDPLRYAPPAVDALVALHRRGHFPDDTQVREIIALALADHTVAADDLATVLYTTRAEALRVLASASPSAPDWPRRLALLVALAAQGVGTLPVGAAITAALPDAPDPEPFLRALRDLRYGPAEEAVLAALPRCPSAALEALAALGSNRTVEALGTLLDDALPAYLRPLRQRATEVWWLLGPPDRAAALARLDPHDLPPAVRRDLGGPDPRELAVLAAALDPDDPRAALCTLADAGDAATLPAIADLLHRVVADLAATPPGDSTTTRDTAGCGAPAVPDDVIDAISGLGRRLFVRGRIRPAALLDAADPAGAGHAVLADLALDLLERPDPAPGERPVLLDLLRRVPYPRTHARVHHLLRDPDPEVRKRVVALLAESAPALSASLIALTRSAEAGAVREAVTALGAAGAAWAAEAIAACLEHPTMSVKKAAAEALARAGTPVVVPALVGWLGRHDNPGLRASLRTALGAVLGDGWPEVVLTAASGAEARTVELLLTALDRALDADQIRRYAERAPAEDPASTGSRPHDAVAGGDPVVAEALLALVAQRRVRLRGGTLGDLAGMFRAFGIEVPVEPASDPVDGDLRALARDGWDPERALRVALADPRPDARQLRPVRPLLADWLRLAAGTDSGRVLELIVRLCPAPWSDAELRLLSRAAHILVTGLRRLSDPERSPAGPPATDPPPTDPPTRDGPDASVRSGLSGAERSVWDGLLELVGAVGPRLGAEEAFGVVSAVRGLPGWHIGRVSPLPALRACGAVLVRSDLDRALVAADRGPDPWKARLRVLRDAFGEPVPLWPPPAREADAWRAALDAAARIDGDVAAFRRGGRHPDDSRTVLAGLIEVHPHAREDARPALVDWMTALQPLDAPQWTLDEQRSRRTLPDVERSARERARLLVTLHAADPAQRRAAAETLLAWPEPEHRRAVLEAFLDGRVELRPTEALAATMDASMLARGPEVARVAALIPLLAPERRTALAPWLLERWRAGVPAALHTLRQVPADSLADLLSERLAAGDRGLLDLFAHRPVLRTPALERFHAALREAGDDTDALLLVDGPLRQPGAAQRDVAALAALRRVDRVPGASAPDRAELIARAGQGDRRALNALMRDAPRPDPALVALVDGLLRHPQPRLRLHALRLSRRVLDRADYLRHATILLADPLPDVVRRAVLTVSHGGHAPAVPALVRLLEHRDPVVRRAVADGLVRLGEVAAPALRHARGKARPDRRARYTQVLAAMEAAQAAK
jgi:HEAT repeat protein